MHTYVKVVPNDRSVPAGKLADVELHFAGGELDGLKLIGFAVWARRDGGGKNVTFPARQFTVHVSGATTACSGPSRTCKQRSGSRASCFRPSWLTRLEAPRARQRR